MSLKNNLLMGAFAAFCAGSLFAEVPADQRVAQLKEELGLSTFHQLEAKQKDCHLYIVHHGDTEYTLEERLQGWIDIPLNDVGRLQMKELGKKLLTLKIDAIYSSSLIRAAESAEILGKDLKCSVIMESALRGESHGTLEGLKKEECRKDSHYIQYKALSSEERIFFSVGEGGLSKADIARRAIPAIKEICKKHPGQNVLIVTHGGVLKLINFLLGNYTSEQFHEVPHADMLRIDGDGTCLVLPSHQG